MKPQTLTVISYIPKKEKEKKEKNKTDSTQQ
jgi:hypothetical protein